jgi:hypothetical protein
MFTPFETEVIIAEMRALIESCPEPDFVEQVAAARSVIRKLAS